MVETENKGEVIRPLVQVVEDEPINRSVVAEVLRAGGFDVAAASSGEEALRMIREKPPRLVLLDILMPGMNGLEVCRRLKADLSTRKIPVIFLTAQAKTKDLLAGFEAGGVDYITKPYECRELLARVRTHVELSQLKSILPICSYCKKIRTEDGEWQDIEVYIRKRTGTRFSHGLCPECFEKVHVQHGDEE